MLMENIHPLKIVATIEARMTSTRLPGKVLMPVMGKPMLEYMIERVRRVPGLDEIIVATTVNETDQPIVDLAERLGIGWFRGSENDVMGRVLNAAQAYDADVIVELTGDCPLIDPDIISSVIRCFSQGEADYASNLPIRTYPIGMETQVFPTSILADAISLTQDPTDHEHVSLYIYSHPERYHIVTVDSGLPRRWHGIRLTLDTVEDFELIHEIFKTFYPSNPQFTLRDILTLLRSRPELLEGNLDVARKPVRA